MKLVTWNVNSSKTLKNYHPFLNLTFAEILDSFGAEVVCFQEIKSSQLDLGQEYHTLDNYYCFYDLNSKGSNGVGTFVKKQFCPVRVEIGFASGDLGYMDDLSVAFTPARLRELDSEGRCVISDHTSFVLFNVYFPCYSTKRAEFKTDFSRAIQIRIDSFIKSGRSVILAADINVMHKEIDCYNVTQYLLDHEMESFMDSPYRQWLDKWLKSSMMDTFRHFYPDKPHVYTVWNTRENKRPANHGTRIDYILSSRDLVSKFLNTIVESHIMGSDHAPVVSILDDSLLVRYENSKPPKGCTFYWKNYGGKQKTLDTFFGKFSATPDSNGIGGLNRSSSSFEKLEKKIGVMVNKKRKKPVAKLVGKTAGKQKVKENAKDKSQKTITSFLKN